MQTSVHAGSAMVGAATALAAVAGAPALAAAATGLATVDPTPGRLVPIALADGTLILDDTYNASPRSMALSLEAAGEIARARGARAVAILGDMKELGERSRAEHLAIGRHAVEHGVRTIIACGPESGAIAAAAQIALGLESEPTIYHFADPEAAFGLVRGVVRPGDVILVKGSRSMRMERVVAVLRGGGEGST